MTNNDNLNTGIQFMSKGNVATKSGITTYSKEEILSFIKKAMEGRGRVIYTGSGAVSYNDDGVFDVPEETDYVELTCVYCDSTPFFSVGLFYIFLKPLFPSFDCSGTVTLLGDNFI